jgi:parvulin-like peptidyl-prolyl isomerase
MGEIVGQAATRLVRRMVGGLLAVSLVACAGQQGGQEGAERSMPVDMPRPAQVVADVGGGFVTPEEFAAAAGATPGSGPDMDLSARKEVLDQLLTDEVLLQEALRQGLVRDAKVRRTLTQLLLRQEVYDKVSRQDFTDEELKAYYDDHRDEFIVPEKLQIKRILVRVGEGHHTEEEARAIIEEARKKVKKDPDSFRTVAEQVSEGVHQRRGGDLGFVPRSGKPGVDAKVAEVAFGLKMGQVSDIFEADEGLNFVMPVNKRAAVERTFNQMKGSVLRKLRTERFQELTDRYIDTLRQATPAKIDEAALMKVEVRARPALPGRGPGGGMPGGHTHGADEDHEHGDEE